MRTCRQCQLPFDGKPHWHTCPDCYWPTPKRKGTAAPTAASKLERVPNQLALDDLPEWADATSHYLAYEYNRRNAA